MAARKQLSGVTGEVPEEMRLRPTEFKSDAPEPGAGLVLADNVHSGGVVWPVGTLVECLPEPLRSAVLANAALAVKAE